MPETDQPVQVPDGDVEPDGGTSETEAAGDGPIVPPDVPEAPPAAGDDEKETLDAAFAEIAALEAEVAQRDERIAEVLAQLDAALARASRLEVQLANAEAERDAALAGGSVVLTEAGEAKPADLSELDISPVGGPPPQTHAGIAVGARVQVSPAFRHQDESSVYAGHWGVVESFEVVHGDDSVQRFSLVFGVDTNRPPATFERKDLVV